MTTNSMTPPALSLTNDSDHTQSQIITPGRLLGGVVFLTLAADVLLWKAYSGAGLAVFALLVWCVLLWNRPIGRRVIATPKDAIAISLMLATAGQTMLETGFANVCLLLVLTVYASGHFLHRDMHPYWRRLLEGCAGFLWFPASLFQGRYSLPTVRVSVKPGIVKNAIRCLFTILPALVICIPFALLLLGGNAILFATVSDYIDEFATFIESIEAPDILRILFWCFVLGVTFALLGRGEPSRVLAWISDRVPRSLAVPADLSVGIWRTRLMLIAVNVLFFFANTTDVLYLWAEATLPANVTASEFVHQGVYSLIASVLLAALVLSLLFVQSREVCRAPGQRWLAHLWIVQNLVLVSSVVLRLLLYVDFYQLSLLRVYVVCFLVLVSVGFVLLAIRVHQERSISWLVGANLLSVFSLFFVMQCWDEHRFVAQWNVNAAVTGIAEGKQLDIAYLGSLGPSAWPSLHEIASQPDAFGRRAAADAAGILSEQSVQYHLKMAAGGWRAWQWRQHVAAQQFEAQ